MDPSGSSSKARTPRTAGRKKKSAHPHHEERNENKSGHDMRGDPRQTGPIGGMGYRDENPPKPASRGGDGSSRQSFREHTMDSWMQNEPPRTASSRTGQFIQHKAMYPKYSDPHEMQGHESSLPHIHNPHRDDPAEQSTDSFLADYLGTLDKQARNQRHHVSETLQQEDDRRSRGHVVAASSSSKQPPAPFFRKPTNRTTYDLSSGPSTHFGLNKGSHRFGGK